MCLPLPGVPSRVAGGAVLVYGPEDDIAGQHARYPVKDAAVDHQPLAPDNRRIHGAFKVGVKGFITRLPPDSNAAILPGDAHYQRLAVKVQQRNAEAGHRRRNRAGDG